MKRLLVPSFDPGLLPRMLAIAFVGALVAGTYGVLHDQVTYSISREYFTEMKFLQFAAADFGFPERVLVAEIGFLGTWWAGLISGWFLARIAVPVWPARQAWRMGAAAFAVMAAAALAFAVIGSFLRAHHFGLEAYWQEMCLSHGVGDAPAFVRVAYIHYCSYFGGIIGFLIAMVFLKGCKKRALAARKPMGAD
jgi:hypothetical protein